MAKGSSKRSQIVPEAHKALDAMKYEIAAELGLPVGQIAMNGADTEFASELGSISSASGSSREDYWGHISARDAGAVGGHITQRLIRNAEQDLFSLSGL